MAEDEERRDRTRQHGVTAVTENQLRRILSVSQPLPCDRRAVGESMEQRGQG